MMQTSFYNSIHCGCNTVISHNENHPNSPDFPYPVVISGIPGKGREIADGDTFTVLANDEKQRIRIFGIDAPEHDQPGGAAATHDLTALILARRSRSNRLPAMPSSRIATTDRWSGQGWRYRCRLDHADARRCLGL